MLHSLVWPDMTARRGYGPELARLPLPPRTGGCSPSRCCAGSRSRTPSPGCRRAWSASPCCWWWRSTPRWRRRAWPWRGYTLGPGGHGGPWRGRLADRHGLVPVATACGTATPLALLALLHERPGRGRPPGLLIGTATAAWPGQPAAQPGPAQPVVGARRGAGPGANRVRAGRRRDEPGLYRRPGTGQRPWPPASPRPPPWACCSR